MPSAAASCSVERLGAAPSMPTTRKNSRRGWRKADRQLPARIPERGIGKAMLPAIDLRLQPTILAGLVGDQLADRPTDRRPAARRPPPRRCAGQTRRCPTTAGRPQTPRRRPRSSRRRGPARARGWCWSSHGSCRRGMPRARSPTCSVRASASGPAIDRRQPRPADFMRVGEQADDAAPSPATVMRTTSRPVQPRCTCRRASSEPIAKTRAAQTNLSSCAPGHQCPRDPGRPSGRVDDCRGQDRLAGLNSQAGVDPADLANSRTAQHPRAGPLGGMNSMASKRARSTCQPWPCELEMNERSAGSAAPHTLSVWYDGVASSAPKRSHRPNLRGSGLTDGGRVSTRPQRVVA